MTTTAHVREREARARAVLAHAERRTGARSLVTGERAPLEGGATREVRLAPPGDRAEGRGVAEGLAPSADHAPDRDRAPAERLAPPVLADLERPPLPAPPELERLLG